MTASRKTPKGRVSSTSVLIAAIGVGALVLSGLALWKMTELETSLKGPPAAVTVSPSPTAWTDSQPVKVSASLAHSAIVGTGSSGLVTAVGMRAGEVVAPGSVVLEINGVGVVAARTDTIFYRPLSVGAVGEDVDALHAVLRDQLGLAVPSGSSYTWETRAAVVELEKRIGASATGSFSPSYLVRIPHDDFVPDEVSFSLGQRVDGASELASTTVASAVRLEPMRKPNAGNYTLTAQSEEFVVTADAEGRLAVENEPELQRLLRGVADADTTTPEVDGNLSLTEGLPVLAIPAAGIVVDGDRSCVVVETDESTEIRRVVVVGSEPTGAALLEPEISDITTASKILLSGTERAKVRTCPS